MLSRRNIRIKVMQMLYSMNRDEQLNRKEALRRYGLNIKSAFDLYLLNLYALFKVAKYATTDLQNRATKHLPSSEDKIFTDKLASNELIATLANYKELDSLFTELRFHKSLDKDTVRQLYIEFAKSEPYKNYLQADDSLETHRQLLLKLYKFLVSSDVFNAVLEDYSSHWSNDKSLVIGTVKKTIKGLPTQSEFLDKHRPSPETVVDFGEKMLKYVIDNDKELLGHIEPSLKNWDADRVAIMDMVLLKMAIAELLLFPTIPTKVTLNEFVEIAKLYSTDKSKDFVNGILDRIMKKLEKAGKIQKQGRGLMD